MTDEQRCYKCGASGRMFTLPTYDFRLANPPAGYTCHDCSSRAECTRYSSSYRGECPMLPKERCGTCFYHSSTVEGDLCWQDPDVMVPVRSNFCCGQWRKGSK